MSLVIAPDENALYRALRAFLKSVLPDGVVVAQGQLNRVPEPKGKNFALFNPLRSMRLSTNAHDYQIPTQFIGFMTANLMLVNEIEYGLPLAVGQRVQGTDVADETFITADLTGNGGPGAYEISPEQTLTGSFFVPGSVTVETDMQVSIQVALHGDNNSSANNAAIIASLFRDSYAVDLVHAIAPSVTPLYASDPRQVPFINEAQQFESRWVVELEFQMNLTTLLPQDFATVIDLTLISVDVTYPPT